MCDFEGRFRYVLVLSAKQTKLLKCKVLIKGFKYIISVPTYYLLISSVGEVISDDLSKELHDLSDDACLKFAYLEPSLNRQRQHLWNAMH